jgi:single-strand DNA-binding protein
MSRGLNKQQIIGRLVDDAQLAHVGQKRTPKCVFRLVANTGWGEYEHTEGFNVVLWSKRAESLSPYLTRGARLYVEGETRTRSWQGDDGQRHYRTEVVAGEIMLLSSGNGGRGNGGHGVHDHHGEDGDEHPGEYEDENYVPY